MTVTANKLRPFLYVNGRASQVLAIAAAVISMGGSALAAASAATAAPDTDSHVALIREARAYKDSLFRHSADSPLPTDARDAFGGLSYFPVDMEFRFVGDLHRYGRPRLIQFPSNSGTNIEVERFGRFVFEYSGKTHWLEIVRSVEAGDLSVFFKDLTNGRGTYAAGRYARVSAENGAGGRYVLDLNEAYNPYCAYNPAYVCPLPPRQNELPYPARAGERHE
jgi:uncharacterized protein (DUF1684 family)